MGDTSETNTKVLSRELVLGDCGNTKNAYTEKSLFAQQGPLSQVQSHFNKKIKVDLINSYMYVCI